MRLFSSKLSQAKVEEASGARMSTDFISEKYSVPRAFSGLNFSLNL